MHLANTVKNRPCPNITNKTDKPFFDLLRSIINE